ncbi:MAG: hypothetical protein ACJA1J_001764 [Sulfitobacter pontiacus]|jgi:hypothetical protein
MPAQINEADKFAMPGAPLDRRLQRIFPVVAVERRQFGIDKPIPFYVTKHG